MNQSFLSIIVILASCGRFSLSSFAAARPPNPPPKIMTFVGLTLEHHSYLSCVVGLIVISFTFMCGGDSTAKIIEFAISSACKA